MYSSSAESRKTKPKESLMKGQPGSVTSGMKIKKLLKKRLRR